MHSEIEIEFKNYLSESDFIQLLDYFNLNEADSFCQKNTYYDTDDFQLKSLNTLIRHRQFEHSSEWTIKSKLKQHHALEISEPASSILAPPIQLSDNVFSNEGFRNHLALLNIPLRDLHQTYTLTTQRYTIKVPLGEFALDKSTYLNHTDYEVEFETTASHFQEALDYFHSVLRANNIPIKSIDKKIERVAQYYQKFYH